MEHIKQKVEKLITAYKNKSAQLEQLKVENKNLLSRLSEIESKQEQSHNILALDNFNSYIRIYALGFVI